METNKFNDVDCKGLAELPTININAEIFEQIKYKIIDTFNQLGIDKDGMSIYYERHTNGSSILAIKLSDGNDADFSNYMINVCVVEYRNNKPSYDIGLHANAKVSQNAMHIANSITKDIIAFFKSLEKDLFDKNLSYIEFSLRIPLGAPKEKLPLPKKNNFKTRIRRLFTK